VEEMLMNFLFVAGDNANIINAAPSASETSKWLQSIE